jgi:hypothetical protein
MLIIILNIFLVVVLSFLFASLLNAKWAFVKKLFFGYVLLFSLNTVCGYFFQLLNISVRTGILSMIYLLLIGFIVYYLKYKKEIKLRSLFHWSRVDTSVLIGIVLFSILLLVPTLRERNGILNLTVPAGEDVVNHFFLVNAINQEGQYIYHDYSQNNKVPKGIKDYPQATHFNLVTLLGGQYSSDFKILLTAFKFYNAFSLILLFVFFIYAALDVIKNSNKLPYYSYGIILFFVLIIFSSSIFATSYLHGFVSQIFALALMLSLIIAINSKKDFQNRHLWILSIIMLNAAIAGSWFFITPIALAISIFTIYKSNYRYQYIAYFITAILVLPPIYYSITSGSLNSINAAGGVDQIPAEFIVVFIVGTIISIWNYKKLRESLLTNWLVLLIFSAIFSALLMVYQFVISRTLSYYFYKSLYTPILVLSILFTVSILISAYLVIERFEKVNKTYSLVIILMGLSLVAVSLLYRNSTGGVYFGIVSKKQYINSSDFSRLELIAAENRANPDQLMIKGSGSNVSDYIYSKWLAAMNLNFPNSYEDSLANDTLYQNKKSTETPSLNTVKIIHLR